AIYVVPYFSIVLGFAASNLLLFYGAWLLMALGMVGIGCSVMHDSNHDAYSGNKTLNRHLGKIIMLVGGYDLNWRIQHNILHHTYTNIDGLDHDIDAGVLLRFSPAQPKRGFHKYQHLYAWFLYGLMTIFWTTQKDFKQLIEYNELGLLKKEKTTLRKAMTRLISYKVFYYIVTLVLPLLFSG